MGTPYDDVPTAEVPAPAYLEHLAEAAAAAETDPAGQPSRPIPVAVSHAVTLLVMLALGGVNATVWATVPGGEAAVVSVVSAIAQGLVSALAAWWAHSRVSPIPDTGPGRHALPA